MRTRRKHPSRGPWARRLMGLGAAAAFTMGLLVAPSTPPIASADDCPDAEVIFARGTDEPKGLGRVGDAFVDALRDQTGLNIRTYGVNYDAGKLQLDGGNGAKDAINRVKSTVKACPDTPIVLGGYSQGASVINIVTGVKLAGIQWGDPLPAEYAENIAAVATFGGIARRADGVPAQSALLGSKSVDLCNPKDPICHAGSGNAWSGHTEGYVPVYTNQAATFASAKLLAALTPPEPEYGPLPGPSPAESDPNTALHGPLPGPATGSTPGTGTQTPGTDPSTSAPTALPSENIGWVSAIR